MFRSTQECDYFGNTDKTLALKDDGAPGDLRFGEPRATIRTVVFDGQRINIPKSEGDLWSLTYCAVPPEGIEITLEIESSQSLTLQVSDNSWGLPDIPGTTFQPRQDDMMPMPNFDYGTVVARTLQVP